MKTATVSKEKDERRSGKKAFNSLPSDSFIIEQIQIESICTLQNKCNPKIEICFEKGRKHCWEMENAGYHHFLLFLQSFF